MQLNNEHNENDELQQMQNRESANIVAETLANQIADSKDLQGDERIRFVEAYKSYMTQISTNPVEKLMPKFLEDMKGMLKGPQIPEEERLPFYFNVLDQTNGVHILYSYGYLTGAPIIQIDPIRHQFFFKYDDKEYVIIVKDDATRLYHSLIKAKFPFPEGFEWIENKVEALEGEI